MVRPTEDQSGLCVAHDEKFDIFKLVLHSPLLPSAAHRRSSDCRVLLSCIVLPKNIK